MEPTVTVLLDEYLNAKKTHDLYMSQSYKTILENGGRLFILAEPEAVRHLREQLNHQLCLNKQMQKEVSDLRERFNKVKEEIRWI